jgi:hypothetical protein
VSTEKVKCKEKGVYTCTSSKSCFSKAVPGPFTLKAQVLAAINTGTS